MKINNRRDILLLMLYSPGVGDEPNEPIVGRTRLVKMLFLFQKEFGDSFRRGTEIAEDGLYCFFASDYGPFSGQIYDDIEFFYLHKFIESSSAREETPPESLGEWGIWLSESDSADNEEIVEYSEEEFSLSKERGFPFAAELYALLNENQKKMLRFFKRGMVKTPLRAIIRYVYGKYPELTGKSKIRDSVFAPPRY